MNWKAPELLHILEGRLQQARVELMEDQRVAGSLSGGLIESEAFVAELIEKKLAVAAQTGMDAVEASLRVGATDFLLEAGMELDAVREVLAKAGDALRNPPGMRRSSFAEVAFSPLVLGSLTLLGWTLGALALWLMLDFHPLVLVGLVAIGAAPALGVKRWRERELGALRRKVAGELPARICRHYTQAYEEGVRGYEAAVNGMLAGRETI